jgi:hypothetical protein
VPSNLRSAAFPDASLADSPMATYVVTDETSLDHAAVHIIEYFGADRERQTVRLRFPTEVRYLARHNLYPLLETLEKGFGQGGYSTVPGYPVPGQAREYEFRCLADSCPDSPVFMLAFDEPPVCPRHGAILELVQ